MSRLALLISKEEGFGIPGTVPTRRNNPGDLRHAPHASHAGIGPDDIGIEPTAAAGWSDLDRQLNLYASRGLTLRQMIVDYYAPPNENDTDHYVDFIENQTGLSRDDIVGDLSEDKLGALADAINTMEGGHEGETYEAGASDNPDWVDHVIGSGSDDGSDVDSSDGDQGC